MAVYGPLQLTTNGQALYTKAQSGTTLQFTRMQIGGGQLANGQDPTTLTALISPIAYFDINSNMASGSTAVIRGIFENTNLTASTYVCEIGLFAQDPTLGEILYAYANAGTQGDTLPPIADGLISRQFNLSLTVGNATNVTVNLPATNYIPQNEIGVANGVASLDANAKVPVAQIPSLSYVPTSAEGVANGVATLDSGGSVPLAQLGNAVTSNKANTFTQLQTFSDGVEANQVILGSSNNISSPTSPIFLAPANASGVGMDGWGNLLPINPASVASGNNWKVEGKNGETDFQVYIDGTHKVATKNNVLDDGSGNATVTGQLTTTNGVVGASGNNLALTAPSTKAIVLSQSGNADTLTVTGNNIQNTTGTGNIILSAGSSQGYAVLQSPNDKVYLETNVQVSVTKPGTTATFMPLQASNVALASLEKWKTNIVPWGISALDTLSESVIYEYDLKSELEDGITKKRHGLVIGRETPEEVIAPNGESIDLYAFTSLNTKAIQELKTENDELKSKLSALEQQLALVLAKLEEE